MTRILSGTPRVAAAVLLVAATAAVAAPIVADRADGQQIRISTPGGNTVDVTVSNAGGGKTFRIDGEGMSGYNAAEQNAKVNVEAIQLRLNQAASFEMNLNYRPGTDPSTPSITGVEPISKINLTHPDLSNSNIAESSIEFAVKTSALDRLKVTPDDVVFYRLDGDTWEEQNVAKIEERHNEIVYETRMTQLSWLAIGVKQPEFKIMNPYLGVTEIPEGGDVTVFVKVFNDGSTKGTLPLTVTTDGTVLARRNVSLGPGESQNLEIPVGFDTIGEYGIAVNNKDVGTLRVVPEGEADPQEQRGPGEHGGTGNGSDGGNESGDGGGNGMPGFTAVAALLAAAGAAAVARR